MVVQPIPGVKVRPTDNDTICKIIRKSRMNVVEYCMHFVIHFLYISLSASTYSKVSKTKSCLFVDISVQTCVVKYYLEEKKIVLNCVYILVFLRRVHIDPMVLVNVTFFMVPEQG